MLALLFLYFVILWLLISLATTWLIPLMIVALICFILLHLQVISVWLFLGLIVAALYAKYHSK